MDIIDEIVNGEKHNETMRRKTREAWERIAKQREQDRLARLQRVQEAVARLRQGV